MKPLHSTLVIAGGLALGLVPQNAAALVAGCFEFPTDGSVNVQRNAGLKDIIELTMSRGCPGPAFTAGDAEMPLALNAADGTDVTLTIDGIPMSCTLNSSSPGVSQCGASIVESAFSNPGVADTVRVSFGGFLDPDATVSVDIDDVVDDTGATSGSFGWSFATTGADPRPNASLALVLDKSGSMASPTIGGGPQKIRAVEDAVKVMVNALPPYAIDGDRIGLVFFDSDAHPQPPPSGPILVDMTEISDLNDIKHAAEDATAFGATSVGDGLLSAHEHGFDGDDNPTQSIVLLTDGLQNVSALVDEDATFNNLAIRDFSIDGLDYNTAYDICTFSIGIGEAANREFNDTLAEKRCAPEGSSTTFGTYDVESLASASDQSELREHFLTIMQNTLIGDKLETVRVADGRVGSKPAIEHFLVSERDIHLSLVIGWTNERIQRLDFALKSPGVDGVTFRPTHFTQFENNSAVVSFRLPPVIDGERLRHAGAWQLIINPKGDRSQATEYAMIAMVDNATIATEMGFDGGDFGTGAPLPLFADVTEQGKPVKEALVVAEVLHPKDGVGNLLSEIGVDMNRSANDRQRDTLTPTSRRLALLLQVFPDVRELLSRSHGSKVLLTDDDGDGRYEGSYSDTKAEGIYEVRYHIAASTGDNGGFARTKLLTRHVRTKADRVRTRAFAQIVGETGNGTPIVAITIIPHDRIGNFVGPGFLTGMDIIGEKAEPLGEIADNLDGSYTREFAMSQDVLPIDPVFTATLRSVVISKRPLSDHEKGP